MTIVNHAEPTGALEKTHFKVTETESERERQIFLAEMA